MAKNNKITKKNLNDNWGVITKLHQAGELISAIAKKFNVSRQALSARLNKEVVATPSTGPLLKVLLLDIETSPLLSWTWGLWQQNIGQSMRIEDNRSYMMSCSMKWLGNDEAHYFESRTEDDSHILKAVLKFVDEADVVIAHNGKAFDMKKINAFALINGLNPPSPYRQIDTLLEARKHFKFERNTLAYLADILDCSPKLEHKEFAGFDLWRECIKGNDAAWKEMKQYNMQDLITLEEVYLKMRPYIKGHPNMATPSDSLEHRCTACGSTNLLSNGYTITNVSKFERFVCGNCGSFSRGRKNLIGKDVRDALLTSVAN